VSNLLSWAEHEFNLNKTDDKGTTEREHLLQVERQTGHTPKDTIPLASHVYLDCLL